MKTNVTKSWQNSKLSTIIQNYFAFPFGVHQLSVTPNTLNVLRHSAVAIHYHGVELKS